MSRARLICTEVNELKKIIFINIIIFVTVILNGCSFMLKENNSDNSDISSDDSLSINEEDDISGYLNMTNELIKICDINNEVIGEIEHHGIITQTEDSIIYTKKLPSEDKYSITQMDYYRYNFTTGEEIKLGSVEKWVHQSTDTVYINKHLYLFVCTGDGIYFDQRTLKFIDINLNNNTMSEIYSEKGGWPYNSMTAAGNKVLMTRILKNEGNLEEYNPETKEIKILKTFDFDDESNVGETVRQISADEDTISLLILKMQTESDVELRIDTYDYDMNLLSSAEMSEVSSDYNDLRQGVAQFDVLNDYVYYENYSCMRFLGKIEGNTVKKIEETNDGIHNMAYETAKKQKTSLFFKAYSNKENYLYLFNSEDGSIKKADFHADDERYYIINASRDEYDNLLLFMYYRNPDTGEQLEPRMYYIKMSDLVFK